MARFVLSGFVLMIVGTVLVSMIALIAHRPTRKIGLGMLLCSIVLPVLLVGGVTWKWNSSRDRSPPPPSHVVHGDRSHSQTVVIRTRPAPRGDQITTLIAESAEDLEAPRIDLDAPNPPPPVGLPPAPREPEPPVANAPRVAQAERQTAISAPVRPSSPQAERPGENSQQQLPSWVSGAKSSRGTERWTEVVTSSPVDGSKYAQRELDELITVAAGHVLDDVLGDHVLESKPPQIQLQHARRELAALGIGPREIRRRFVTEEFIETRWSEALASEMQVVHLKLEFEPTQRDELLARWQAVESERRLGKVGMIGTSLLVLLAGFYSALRIDTATKGYYSKRLLLGATLVTIAVAAVNVLLFTR